MKTAVSGKGESLYDGAARRIPRFMICLALLFTGVSWLRFGWRTAIGFAFGSAIAYLNFHWLERVVSALADRVTSTGQPTSSRGVVGRFLFRYLLMALGGYVIFSFSPASLYGLLAGLFLPVAGIACEAVYELYASFARGA
ncbi:MAG TPA: ATP synthase subunit I [Terriglobales bacterium]|nr:ATP synthase subunit I [Terriglobales bacterium]